MGQISSQFLAVFLFQAATASLSCMDKRIIRQVNLFSAVAAAMPYHGAALVVSPCRKKGNKGIKALSANVDIGIVLLMLPACASGTSAVHKHGAIGDVIFPAGASAQPSGRTAARSFHSFDHG